jgi:oligopeptide/dipeptide ABC transporter ATP-binding protein
MTDDHSKAALLSKSETGILGGISSIDNPAPLAGDDLAPKSILEVEHLRVRLRRGSGTVTIVDDVSIVVKEGAAVAIVGESGAGKSVSTRAVLDLLDPRRFEVEGTIRLGGVDLSTLSRRERRRHISRVASLVFQDPTRSLNPTMKVGAQIAEAMYKSKARSDVTKSQAKVRSLELMRDVGIADPEERFFAFPHELSGGMRQRIVIAIALACQPKIIFCDEPTSSLDVTTQAQIMELLARLREDLGLSLVLITHDLSLAASRVDDVIVMYQGRVVERLPSKGLFAGAAMPYTEALLKAIPGDEEGHLPEPMPTLPYRLQAATTGCSYHPLCPRAADVCREVTPELTSLEVRHDARCFFPKGSDERASGANAP